MKTTGLTFLRPTVPGHWRWLLAVFAIVSGCANNPDEGHRVRSVNYTDRQERIQRLTAEIRVFSIIYDAEYDLFNVNGLKQSDDRLELPGASSGRYRLLVRIDPDSIETWLPDYLPDTTRDATDTSWRNIIPALRKHFWKPVSPATAYRTADGRSRALAYPADGMLFKDISWD